MDPTDRWRGRVARPCEHCTPGEVLASLFRLRHRHYPGEAVVVEDKATRLANDERCCLNDALINRYIVLLNARPIATPGLQCHCLNTFYWTKLMKDGVYNYNGVKQPNISELQRLLLPLHLGNHWATAVI